MTHISVCIATYRRPGNLALLLDDLARQLLPPDEVVVVDNDVEGSAMPAVLSARARGLPYRLLYELQPEKNIAITRNRSVAMASGQWLAFIDDDERAPREWLLRLLQTADRYLVDAVQAPVVPELPDTAPAWLRRGGFYDYPRQDTGSEVARNRLRLGNFLLRRDLLRDAEPFDRAYGLTGGEDGDLLARLAAAGTRIVWCDEAEVIEPVTPTRLSLGWLLRRSLRGGQDFARHLLAGRYGPVGRLTRPRLFLRASTRLLAAALLSLLYWPLGRHRAVRWLLAVSANLGKLSQLAGWHYREYA